MEKSIVEKNIVLLGEFKPSKFDKLFFIKNAIITEDEFSDDSIFLPDFSLISTNKLTLEINENRILIEFKNEIISKFNFEAIENISKIVSFGFNFKWLLFPDDLCKKSRNYFYLENSIINKYFYEDNSAFGYYASTNYENSRIKMDVKPIQIHSVNNSEIKNALDFNFNFHFENQELLDTIAHFDRYQSYTAEIINNYE